MNQILSFLEMRNLRGLPRNNELYYTYEEINSLIYVRTPLHNLQIYTFGSLIYAYMSVVAFRESLSVQIFSSPSYFNKSLSKILYFFTEHLLL